jgi:hypothetical protein
MAPCNLVRGEERKFRGKNSFHLDHMDFKMLGTTSKDVQLAVGYMLII